MTYNNMCKEHNKNTCAYSTYVGQLTDVTSTFPKPKFSYSPPNLVAAVFHGLRPLLTAFQDTP